MNSRIRQSVSLFIFLMVLYLVQGCAATGPTPPSVVTITAAIAVTATVQPTSTKTLTPTLQPTISSTPVPSGNFVLFFYPTLTMNYDPAIWEDKSNYTEWGANLNPVPGTIINNYLQALDFETCQIGVIGPSGYFPPAEEIVRLGNVRFQLTISEDESSGVKTAHYIEDKSLTNYNYDQGLPVVEIAANSSEWDECKAMGEEVLSTLHSPPN